jgi:hypothetical protein
MRVLIHGRLLSDEVFDKPHHGTQMPLRGPPNNSLNSRENWINKPATDSVTKTPWVIPLAIGLHYSQHEFIKRDCMARTTIALLSLALTVGFMWATQALDQGPQDFNDYDVPVSIR